MYQIVGGFTREFLIIDGFPMTVAELVLKHFRNCQYCLLTRFGEIETLLNNTRKYNWNRVFNLCQIVTFYLKDVITLFLYKSVLALW